MIKGISQIVIILVGTILFTDTFSKPEKQNNEICRKNPLYCTIIKLRPKINHTLAMRFSNLLYKYGKQFQMDPWRSLAIAMQESSLRNIHRRHEIIVFHNHCERYKCSDSYEYVSGYSDLSIFQIHIKTAIAYKMDPIKLDQDLEYAVYQHYAVLKQKERECSSLGELSWTCYHSKSPSRRMRYRMLVDKYYLKPGIANV